MNIAIDVILSCIVIACIISGRVKGFVAMIMKLASFILSGIGAFLFYTIPADMMYYGVFLPKLTSMIEETILSEGVGMSISELFGTKPDFFVEILNRYSTVTEVESFYNANTETGIREISEFMASPIARGISNILGFAAIFLVLLILLGIVGFIIDKICKLPVLNGTNKLLGMILGAVTGLIFAWVLAWAAGEMLPHLSTAYPDIFDPQILERSAVFRFLYNFNPLTLFNLK